MEELKYSEDYKENYSVRSLPAQNFDTADLELRMYFFVPYNISPIQQGIQAGHALGRFCLRYGRHDPNHMVWDFLEKWETWIILNGGTTNDQRDFEMIPAGTLNLIGDQLQENDIEFAYMIEPDLNNALSALCIICDERVFNREDYPNFIDWLLDMKMLEPAKDEALKNNPDLWVKLRLKPLEEVQEMFPEYYKEWVRFMGGVKNVFLRELIRDKKKA
jgi:hypothetical protein